MLRRRASFRAARRMFASTPQAQFSWIASNKPVFQNGQRGFVSIVAPNLVSRFLTRYAYHVSATLLLLVTGYKLYFLSRMDRLFLYTVPQLTKGVNALSTGFFVRSLQIRSWTILGVFYR